MAALLLSACGGGGSNGGSSNGNNNSIGSLVSEFDINPGLAEINADAAYSRGYFGQGVTVGVIDSGVDASNAEFDGRIIAPTLPTLQSAIDADTQLTINRSWQPVYESIDLSAPSHPTISAAYGIRHNNAKLSFGITRTIGQQTQTAITYRLTL